MTFIYDIIALIVGGGAGAFITRLMTVKRIAQSVHEQLETERQKLSEQFETKTANNEKLIQETIAQKRQTLEESFATQREQLERQKEANQTESTDLSRRNDKLAKREDALSKREEAMDDKQVSYERREQKQLDREEALNTREQGLDQRTEEVDQLETTLQGKLQEISGLSAEEAKDQLFTQLEAELETEQGKLIAKRSKEAEARAKEEATEIVARAVQRYAAEHTAEATISRVAIAEEEFKGRIIGKEGRNIRAFQEATGVDVIIDDTPGQITISCFDGVRREIARRVMEELLADGRIHPARIEEVLTKTQQDMDREIMRYGEEVAFACEVSGLHPQVIKTLGKLQYRTSYGQNVLQHSQEVAFLTGAMAADLGMDPKLGRRCGLLHDIGKALDHEQEGSHPELGYELLKRYNEHAIVCNAALAHHEGHDVLTMYTTLTAAADAISAARPGARRENVERYLKRLQQLEEIACGFRGVQKAYAIQAGRELRVIINSHKMRDDALPKLARDIARRIEDEVAYPGEVKVTTIRETRQQAVAR